MKHVRDYKNYNTLIIKAFFKTVDRVISLKPNLKAKNKSRPDIIRVIPFLNLNAPFNDVFNDVFNDFVLDIIGLPLSKTVIL
jgi:hypothetical protein